MRATLLAFVGGAMFGTGLILGRLHDPASVLGFLDVLAGSDLALPLGFVFASSVFGLLYRAFGRAIERPRPGRIDRRLAIGATLFGAGWGLVGLCPGPAMVSLGGGAPGVSWFLPAMLVGLLFGDARRSRIRTFPATGTP